ncbi:hypothetical protein GGR52DRAFT_589004 [Hypoxylon sp. FL1284]|nr:hypothetical protein GGR52DRAFT_589004 [Hypoxylon sp. FL1284]
MWLFDRAAKAICIASALHTPLGRADPTVGQTGSFSNFGQFAHGLGLSTSDTANLREKYSQADTPEQVTQVACLTALSSLGHSQVTTFPLNQTLVEINWSETCYAEPHCIVQPENSNSVSTILQIIRYYMVKFAIRSGGHSPNPGWSSIGGQGILLDMGKLNSVSLSSDRTFASLGPGARWLQVYEILDVEKAVVVGARVPDVGVGGLILGGGYSYTSNQFGLVADTVKQFEVVLSNGSIVNANIDENYDLFWALKGGGPNFGIVTRYDLYTIPTYEVWIEEQIYSTDQAFEVLAAFDQWQLGGAIDEKSSIALAIALDIISVAFIYSEPLSEPPSVFSPFKSIEPTTVAIPSSNITFARLAESVNSAFQSNRGRHDYRGCSTRIDSNMTQEVYRFWRERAVAVHESTGANQTFGIQHVGPSLVQKGVENGGNPLNLPSGSMQWWTTTVDWENAEDDDLVRSVAIDTTALFKKLARQRGLDVPFVYMNDAARDQNPLASYGPGSVERLKQISRSYDPDQVFQKLQNNGFLLSKI